MNNFERVKSVFEKKKSDTVPFFELALNSNIYRDIFNENKVIPNGSGITKMQLFNKIGIKINKRDNKIFKLSDINKKFFSNFIIDSISNIINLYSKLKIEMIPFRPYDFLISPFYGIYLGFHENLHNITIEFNKNDCGNIEWIIRNGEGFWAKYRFEKKQDTVFMVNDCIKENGRKELIRYIDYLRKIFPEISKIKNFSMEDNEYQYSILDYYYQKVSESSLEGNFFNVGYASIPYPSNSTFHSLFLECMITDPNIIDNFMEISTCEVMNILRILIKHKINSVIDVTDWCYNTGPMFSPHFVKRYIIPYLRKIVSFCHDNKIYYIKHLDGNINSMLPLLIEEVGIDGLHAIEPSAGVDILNIKKRYGNKLTLIGNIDCSKLLVFGKKQEIYNQVKFLIRNLNKDGGFILSSSNSIHNGVPTKNLLYMLEARDKYGKL
ncbi:MAG: uroporphyrinogen decarboxylase family protein [Actinobacteria bacterium]|nr:uroporphyrinogen decarboxylase family protein [Actinomycetota bacterium]